MTNPTAPGAPHVIGERRNPAVAGRPTPVPVLGTAPTPPTPTDTPADPLAETPTDTELATLYLPDDKGFALVLSGAGTHNLNNIDRDALEDFARRCEAVGMLVLSVPVRVL